MTVDVYNRAFMPFDVRPYPSSNRPPFENWFWYNYEWKLGDRCPLPVFWTDYYRKNNYGKDKKAMDALQAHINSLPTSVPYFTIVQYDDGILTDISRLDCKVFAMSGTPTFGNAIHRDNIIPLICQPTKTILGVKRDIEVSFVGSNTHPLRKEMCDVFGDYPKSHVELRGDMPEDEYNEILARSWFALCPRGYGPTSFRITEAIRQGAIPVYISDDHWLPRGTDFSSFGIVMTPQQMRKRPVLSDYLNPMDMEVRNSLEMAAKGLYSFEGCKEWVEGEITVPTSI